MQTIRINALAKELGMSDIEVLTRCEELGIRGGIHGLKEYSTLSDSQANRIRKNAKSKGFDGDPPVANEATPSPPGNKSAIHEPLRMWRLLVLIFMGLLPCIILFSLIPFEGGWKKTLANYPVWTLLIIGVYEIIFFFLASLMARSRLRKLAVKEFEHENSANFQKLQWLSKRKEFELTGDDKRVKHKTSIKLLESAGFSGIEGGASFAAIIVLLATLAAVLLTTLAYFMIGTMLNLIDGRGGFLFENNEGFTAALTLLVVLTASAVVPVYTDLAKTISEQQSIFEEQISSISRNLLLIEQRMDPVWDHYQAITNRFIPEWIHSVDEDLKFAEDNRNELTVNLEASLNIPKLFHQYLGKKIGIEIYHKEVFSDILLLLAPGLRQEKPSDYEELFGQKSEPSWHIGSKQNAGQNSEPEWDKIKKRLLDWTQGKEVEQNWSDELDQQISEKIDHRRRDLAYRPIINGLGITDNTIDYTIADFSPPTEWIVSILVSLVPEKIYEDFRNSIDSTILHHLNTIKPQTQVADIGLFSVCLKSDISADAFLDDYHLFTALQRDFANSIDDKSLVPEQKRAIWARELYYGLYFFTCQDSKSERSKSVRTMMKEKEKALDGQDFFSRLFGDVCELMEEMECQDKTPLERLNENEQLLLTLNFQRSAIHNWIRASQSASRRRRWIELEDAEDKNKTERRSFLGIPVIPTRHARLEDLMRHAGVPINDMKRLRLKTLREIVEPAEMVRTQKTIEDILRNDGALKFGLEQLKMLKENKILDQKYREILDIIQVKCGLTRGEVGRLRFPKSRWGDDVAAPINMDDKRDNRAFPLMKLYLEDLKESDRFSITGVEETNRGMLLQMKRLLLDEFVTLKDWFGDWHPGSTVKDLFLHPFIVFSRKEAEIAIDPEIKTKIKTKWTPELIKEMMSRYTETPRDSATPLEITVSALREAAQVEDTDDLETVDCDDKGEWILDNSKTKWTLTPKKVA